MGATESELLAQLTALREENHQLKVELERYRYASQLSACALWEVEFQSNQQWWSPAFYELLGMDPSTPPSTQSFDEHVRDDNKNVTLRSLAEAISGGDTHWSGVLHMRHSSGRELEVDDRCIILRDDQGAPTRVIGVLIDITRQRHLEARVLRAARTESLGQMSGAIAHDFNNLLTIIFGHLELLELRVGNSSPLLKHITTIMSAAQQGARLTDQLLAFARKRVSKPKVVRVPELLARGESLLRSLLRESIVLRFELEEGLWPVWIEVSQLEQVLMNLTANARDAMPQGGLLTISAHNRTEAPSATAIGGEWVCIEVRDTGEGIPEALRDRIFEPFFTTKSVSEGTGLGLATSHGIITQSGGSLSVQPVEGRGTCFAIRLPRCAEANLRAHDAKVAPPEADSGQESRHHTVLLVEDDLLIRELSQSVLSRAGHHVITAPNGAVAAAVAAKLPEPPALLVTDLVMPMVGGVELADRLTARWPELRVIYTSGYPEETEAVSQAIQGTARFLPKPYAPAQLLALVAEALVP